MCRFTCPREKPKFIRFEMFFRPRGRKGRGEAGLGEVSYSLTTAQIISRLTHRGSVEVERVLRRL